MIVSYYFSSSDGDVPVDDATFARPFIVRPLEAHPFITLGDFFTAVKEFILRDSGQSLINLLSGVWGKALTSDDIEKIIIRYEKYGALYQISSVEILAFGQKAKFAVNTAISDSAKETLLHEFDLLRELGRQRKPSCLPEVYYWERRQIQKGERSENILMTLSEWFDDYHEWHFSQDENGREGIVIWDMVEGWRFASASEFYEIIRQATRILVLYYNIKSCLMIFPWHHGAGDFVVKTDNAAVDVKLITVRGYEPVVPSKGQGAATPSKALLRLKAHLQLEALLQFFLNTTIKMRLDKREGMGGPYWAKAPVLRAVTAGFIDGLRAKELEDGPLSPRAVEVISFLKSLSKDEIKTLFYSHLDEYRLHDPSDAAFIQNHLDEHSSELYLTIQGFSG